MSQAPTSTAASTAATVGLPTLLGLMLAHFTNDFYANFLPVYLPLLREKFGLSLALVGLLSSIFTTAASFLQLAFGVWADRDRGLRRNFALWGPLVTGAFMSVVGVLPSYGLIVGALLLAALGTAMFHPQATALSGRLLAAQGRRGLAVSLFIGAGMLGFSLGPAVMAGALHRWGLEASAWALVPLIALGLGLRALLRGLPALALGSGSGPESTPKSGYSYSASSPSRGARRRTEESAGDKGLKGLAVLWGLVVLRHAVLLSFMTFLVILLQGRGYGYLAGSFALVGFLLVSAPAGLLGGLLSDRWGRWGVTVWSLRLGFAALLGFLFAQGALSLALLLLGGALLSASNPVIVAHAQELLPRRSSTASALVMGVGWGVGALLIGPVGALGDAWGLERALGLTTLAAFGLTLGLTALRRRLGLARGPGLHRAGTAPTLHAEND